MTWGGGGGRHDGGPLSVDMQPYGCFIIIGVCGTPKCDQWAGLQISNICAHLLVISKWDGTKWVTKWIAIQSESWSELWFNCELWNELQFKVNCEVNCWSELQFKVNREVNHTVKCDSKWVMKWITKWIVIQSKVMIQSGSQSELWFKVSHELISHQTQPHPTWCGFYDPPHYDVDFMTIPTPPHPHPTMMWISWPTPSHPRSIFGAPDQPFFHGVLH